MERILGLPILCGVPGILSSEGRDLADDGRSKEIRLLLSAVRYSSATHVQKMGSCGASDRLYRRQSELTLTGRVIEETEEMVESSDLFFTMLILGACHNGTRRLL
jgi:hypothetical protein